MQDLAPRILSTPFPSSGSNVFFPLYNEMMGCFAFMFLLFLHVAAVCSVLGHVLRRERDGSILNVLLSKSSHWQTWEKFFSWFSFFLLTAPSWIQPIFKSIFSFAGFSHLDQYDPILVTLWRVILLANRWTGSQAPSHSTEFERAKTSGLLGGWPKWLLARNKECLAF